MQVITSCDVVHGLEGYIYVSYGKEEYLSHAVVSALTIRRYDSVRPIAIVCPQEHIDLLHSRSLLHIFSIAYILPIENASIVGFKHHIDKFMIFERNLFLDSDMVWCKDPNPLWHQLAIHPFTITGNAIADVYFGSPKGFSIISHIFFNKRKKTMKRFGLNSLPRVQSGVIYAKDKSVAKLVCEKAQYYLAHRSETHFQSRLKEGGRNMESCEWSLAMAMSSLGIHVLPWINGAQSAQLDFIDTFTEYDLDFKNVKSLIYLDEFVYSLRGIPNRKIQQFLLAIFSKRVGKNDHIWVTPFILHFGWLHQKEPFLRFVAQEYKKLLASSKDQ